MQARTGFSSLFRLVLCFAFAKVVTNRRRERERERERERDDDEAGCSGVAFMSAAAAAGGARAIGSRWRPGYDAMARGGKKKDVFC